MQKERSQHWAQGTLSWPLRQHPAVGTRWLTHEHGDDLVAGVLLDLAQPLGQAAEGLLTGDVVGQDQRIGAAVVALRDGAEPLLPRRVPDLQLLPHQGRVVKGKKKTHKKKRLFNFFYLIAALF